MHPPAPPEGLTGLLPRFGFEVVAAIGDAPADNFHFGGMMAPIDLATVDLTVKGGALNRVYALGDPEKNTMNVAVHVIATGSSGSARPTKVNTGTGGEAAGATRFLAKLTR